ncbi:type II toxin-antitoxin system VapC family toxin [bacterium]|nr:type II toxin-antitoxin system VapC family toxin [bacterium]
MTSKKFFIDTSYLIALLNKTDKNHSKAKLLSVCFDERDKFFLHDGILLEIGNSFAKFDRNLAIDFIEETYQAKNKNVEVIPLANELLNEAIELYRERKEKEWGMTDCVSFVLMKKLKIFQALTTDKHFEQAGFTALLLEKNY